MMCLWSSGRDLSMSNMGALDSISDWVTLSAVAKDAAT